jgi:hypothetical protein
LAQAGIVDDAQQSAFTGSINRADVLGEFARHAVQKGAPPKRTLSTQECIAFVNAMVSRWIAVRYEAAIKQGVIK